MIDNNANVANQLPLEFKCFWKGVHVGFEFHELGLNDLLTIHYRTWFYEPGQEKGEWSKNPPFEIDEKRQYTGFQDRNGNKIYFGDTVKDIYPNLESEIYIVKWDITSIKCENIDGVFHKKGIFLNFMELVKEDLDG